MQQPRTALFSYSGHEHLTYPPNHPFRPERAALLMEILASEGVLDQPWLERLSPEPASFEQMERFHHGAYLEAMQRISKGRYDFSIEMLQYGIGGDDCPAFKGLYDLAALSAGASLAGAQLLARGSKDLVFNPIGGFHHAGVDHAEGFCYVNDVVLACMQLADGGLRVANVDLDAHHGNGTQDAFYADPRVLTISTHESGHTLYPWCGFENEIGAGLGRGFNVNLPLPAGTDDGMFVHAFNTVVYPLVERFDPDVLVIEIGMDVLNNDPLTHLRMTNNSVADMLARIRKLQKPVLLFGGGGYDPLKTARGWALAFLVMCDAEPVDDYAGLVGGVFLGSGERSGGLREMRVYTSGAEKERAVAELERTIEFHLEKTFPMNGIG
ncbi:MAG: hypothetical protein P9M14_00390 [Candidatus Alcyoniella australis]|nr:hypothetical protein [Candidatus Alcyoniella australis]